MKTISSRWVGRGTMRFLWACCCGAVIAPTLTAQQLPVQSLQRHLDAARLDNVCDSFVLMLQGKASGWQRLTAKRQGAECHLSDAVVLDSFVQQGSAIVFDANFHSARCGRRGKFATRR